MICHNRVAASQLIRRSLHSSWYKQAPTHCLLLRAIEARVLLDSIKKQPTHPGPFYGPDGRLFERLILPVVPHFRQLYEHLHHSIFLKKNQPGISTNYGKQFTMLIDNWVLGFEKNDGSQVLQEPFNIIPRTFWRILPCLYSVTYVYTK